MTGLFISLEGGEGSGKTTLIKNLVPLLQERTNRKIVVTREPGGIDIAEQIRELILNKENTKMDERTEALLFAASRRQHLVEKVIPALEEGAIVIADRFVDSSVAYQGFARGIGMLEIKELNRFAIDGLMPSMTFLLDIEPEIGLKRIMTQRSDEINRLDLSGIDFHRKVREGYQLIARSEPERVVEIDASQSEDVIAKEVFEKIIQKNQVFFKGE